MIIKSADFVITAVNIKQYPDINYPEIAFVGRSNVGKSSIINTLTKRKNLARVGNTPGKTRQINFFNINGNLSLVDLPGYGYAKVSKAEKESWGKLADTYLNNREQLNLIILLLDIRHKPTKDDITMYNWIKATSKNHFIVATKLDKIKRSQIKNNLKTIRETLQLEENIKIITFSSLKKQGIDLVWEEIEDNVFREDDI